MAHLMAGGCPSRLSQVRAAQTERRQTLQAPGRARSGCLDAMCPRWHHRAICAHPLTGRAGTGRGSGTRQEFTRCDKVRGDDWLSPTRLQVLIRWNNRTLLDGSACTETSTTINQSLPVQARLQYLGGARSPGCIPGLSPIQAGAQSSPLDRGRLGTMGRVCLASRSGGQTSNRLAATAAPSTGRRDGVM